MRRITVIMIFLMCGAFYGTAQQPETGRQPEGERQTEGIQQSESTRQKIAQLTFEKMNHDFGTMKYGGEPQTYDFMFTNTGTAPLVVIRTEVSCRCLTVKYPKKPVAPGESGVISVTYSPDTYIGEFNNSISVFSNGADRRLILLVQGNTLK